MFWKKKKKKGSLSQPIAYSQKRPKLPQLGPAHTRPLPPLLTLTRGPHVYSRWRLGPTCQCLPLSLPSSSSRVQLGLHDDGSVPETQDLPALEPNRALYKALLTFSWPFSPSARGLSRHNSFCLLEGSRRTTNTPATVQLVIRCRSTEFDPLPSFASR